MEMEDDDELKQLCVEGACDDSTLFSSWKRRCDSMTSCGTRSAYFPAGPEAERGDGRTSFSSWKRRCDAGDDDELTKVRRESESDDPAIVRPQAPPPLRPFTSKWFYIPVRGTSGSLRLSMVQRAKMPQLFSEIWPSLLAQGWVVVPAKGNSLDSWHYLPPRAQLISLGERRRGVDYFVSEEDVLSRCTKLQGVSIGTEQSARFCVEVR
jgi:hypothetical protein